MSDERPRPIAFAVRSPDNRGRLTRMKDMDMTGRDMNVGSGR
jgi:hypothetical protein